MTDRDDERTDPSWIGLPRPIQAQLSGIPVSLLDAAPTAVLVEHLRDLGKTPFKLEFLWQGERVELVVRAERILEEFWDMTAKGNVYASELRIVDSSDRYERLLDNLNRSIEKAQQANLLGEIAENVIEGSASIADIGAARRERLTSYIRWELSEGGWHRHTTTSPDQPAEGFTVAAHEPEEQVALLRLAYEEADAEGRKMMRDVAALSLRPWS